MGSFLMANHDRLLKALHKEGLDVRKVDGGWQVRIVSHRDLPFADILLPDELPIESKALLQLANLASVHGVDRCCATPDFHPGDTGVAIGSVVQTQFLIPAAVGTDINCGMRLHLTDLTHDQFMAKRDPLVALLKGDYFYGTRDVAQTVAVQKAMFTEGLLGWVQAQQQTGWRHGMVSKSSNTTQLVAECEKVQYAKVKGDVKYAPVDLVSGSDDKIIRDDGLGTIGGGNHFVEFQVVDEILDRHAAYELGIRVGQVGFMAHTGSRFIGKYVGQNAQDHARKAWEATKQPYPTAHLFPLLDDQGQQNYLKAEATAANYAWVNRMLIAEIARIRMRQVFGADLECPLVTDIPHNITLPHPTLYGTWVQRKGACPANVGDWLLIPGSMGAASYVCKGLGAEDRLMSASHGAGRSTARVHMKRMDDLSLKGVDCITLREERRIEESPSAYKPIQPVVDSQVGAGILSKVARMKPILTFKA